MDTLKTTRTIRHIAFVCLHGSAKSVIAAEYLNRVAAKRGLALHAFSAGREPDPDIPQNVVVGLREKGFDVSGRTPATANAATLAHADEVIAFGCDLGQDAGGKPQRQWSDCPAVSDDFAAAWAYIVAHVDELVAAPVK